eukprot:6231329-Pyramimonas_sp.AAC.1
MAMWSPTLVGADSASGGGRGGQVKEMLTSAMDLLRLVSEKIPRDTRSKPGPGNGIYSPNNRWGGFSF